MVKSFREILRFERYVTEEEYRVNIFFVNLVVQTCYYHVGIKISTIFMNLNIWK